MDDLVARGMKALVRLRQAKSEQDKILRSMGAHELPVSQVRRVRSRSKRSGT